MRALEEALAFLECSESINYAATARLFNCDETTLRRRHQGKQRSRQQADSSYKLRLSPQDLVANINKLTARGIPPTPSMVKNFAQDIAKIEVGKNSPYQFVQRHRDELACEWFDGFDVYQKRADNKYKAYFELVS